MTSSRSAFAGVALAMLVVLAGCSGLGESDDSLTPGEALAGLRSAGAELVSAVGSGDEFVEAPVRRDVPCGGPGGNERSRVLHAYTAGAGVVDDPDEVVSQAMAAAEALDLSPEGPDETSVGPVVRFSGDGFSGQLLVRSSGALQVIGETDCLDNPNF